MDSHAPRSAAARRTSWPGQEGRASPGKDPRAHPAGRRPVGFSPFPGFPRRVGKGHPSHRQKSASKPPNVWGVAALALRCRERSGAGSLSAEIQLGFTCAIPTTPPLLFLLPECGQASPIGGAGLPWSLVSCRGRPSARMSADLRGFPGR